MHHLKNLKFISNDYVIHQNGKDISGHCYGYWREIRIRKNIEQAEYGVTIHKLNSSHSFYSKKLMLTRKMVLAEQDSFRIQLKGVPTRKPDNSYAHYGLMLRLNNNLVIEEIILNRYHSNTEILFIKAPAKKVEQTIDIQLTSHLASLKDAAYQADRNTLIETYHRIVKEIEANGKAPKSIANYYLLLGRIQFSHGQFKEAKEAFTQTNMVLKFKGHPSSYEAIYWFGKVSEVEGKMEEAITFYRLALDLYKDNTGQISREEIETALNG